MSRSFDLPELDDRSHTVLGALARRLRMTEGQLYTVVIALLFAATLLLTGLPGAHRVDASVDRGTMPVEVAP
jgi:hypothetical protein